MTIFERIWKQAAETFGKRNGSRDSLTPYSRTWQTVIQRADHALWMWNTKYGPLSAEQREYAGDLIVDALVKAADAPDDNAKYAYFHQRLTSLLNHETVDAGFDKRSGHSVDDLDADLLNALDGAYGMPVAA